MPKRCISLLLLITLLFTPAAGVFGDVMRKIRAYSIQLDGRPLDVVNRSLWFSSASSEIEEYAEAIKTSPYNPISSNAVMVYASIGADDQTITLNNGQVIDLINSPPEYYFTDMVFIQQKYEEALVDLYYYRAEGAWSRYPASDRRPNVDEAIAGTYWVAQQNGTTYSEEQIQEKFMERLDVQLIPLQEKFNNDWHVSVPKIAEYSDDFISAIREYYLDPCLETFENTIQVAYDIEDEVDENWFEWRSFFLDIVDNVSSGLAVSMLSHGRDMEKELTRP